MAARCHGSFFDSDGTVCSICVIENVISLRFENSFIERYRLPPVLVQKLIGELSPYVKDDKENTIPLHLRVLTALSYYGGACYQRRVGMDAFAMMSQSMVSKNIHEISRAITNHLSSKYIKFPQTRDIELIENRFFDDYGLPGVLALVDCTLIRVAAVPLKKKRSFMSRRRFPAINTQFAIDSDMRILNVNARYPGSTHDTFIWENSRISSLLESNFNLLDQRQNIYRNLFLLGDLGYPLRPWLMTPVKDVRLNDLTRAIKIVGDVT